MTFLNIFNSNDFIDIYTDGSKMFENDNSFVGFATWSEIDSFKFAKKLPDLSSVFTAECFAILSSLDLISNYIVLNPVHKFRIFSDSQSIVKSLISIKGFDKESPLLIDIRSKLYELHLRKVEIKIFWIPSHVKIPGNESVDQMAKDAANGESLMNVGIPSSDLIDTYRKISLEHNKNELINSSISTGKFYFLNFFKESKRPWYFNKGLPREAISLFNRIRCGHTNLNSSLFKYKITKTSLCKCGKDDDTIEHIFWQCHLYNIERDKMLLKLRKFQPYGPYSIINFLTDMNSKIIDILYTFIKNIKINI